MEVNLQAIVDFTRGTIRQPVKTTVQELTGDWRGYMLRRPKRLRGGGFGSDIPTQILGAALEQEQGIEGFVSYSSRVATRRILMVFPHKMLTGSWMRYLDPPGQLEEVEAQRTALPDQ